MRESEKATTRIVGTPQLRKEGVDKVLGRAKYVDDLTQPGLWHGATVRSTIPRGRILAIHYDPAIDWSEFALVSAADIPGKNQIQMISADQPCLAETTVNHCNEAILLLAHPDKRRLPEAVTAIRIDYEPLPAVLSIEESETQPDIIWGEDNIFKQFHLNKGDVDSIWATAPHIVEGEYRTGAQEHLYIENNGVIAEYSEATGVTVRGSLQCPFYVHRSLMPVLDLPAEKVRVIQTETGGAFGGKEDYPSILACHAALLAKKAGHPVKIIYDRMEDLASTPKRHPARIRHRTAVDRNGKLLAMAIEIATDGGAYATLSSTVLSRATLHSTGPYLCPNVRITSTAWATNTVPSGAFRGFGAPQSIFAIERHMDQIARVVGLDPAELRRRNFLHDGDATATEQVMREPVILDALLDRALTQSDYFAKREAFAASNPHSPIQRGLGIAAFYHGSGFTGSGERYLNSLAGLDVTPAGKVRVLVSSTEFGQGTNTILTQIAAEALNLSYDDVEMAPPDTAIVPNSGPTVASRTSMVVGKLLERAGAQLLTMLRTAADLPETYTRKEFFAACARYRDQHNSVESLCRYEAPPNIFWDDQQYRGEAYPAFAWAVYIAEVAVDMTTYTAEVTNFHTVQEVGRVLNPVLAAGQIEGGVAQGIGYALYEKVLLKNGHMFNNQMTNYIMPTAQDVPPIHVHFEEIPFIHGAYGAKGIGELPHDGPAPAILNAIQDAIGESFTSIPLMPEDIFARMTTTPVAEHLANEEPATV
jgi:CO/xanthine dehydrogenase Mo-binding subunit